MISETSYVLLKKKTTKELPTGRLQGNVRSSRGERPRAANFSGDEVAPMPEKKGFVTAGAL